MPQHTDPIKPDDAYRGTERRRFHRAIMQISSCLILEGLKVDCVVQDLSLVGARVEVSLGQPAFQDESIAFNFLDCTDLEIGTSVSLPINGVWSNANVADFRFLCDPDDIAKHLEHLIPEDCFKFLLDERLKNTIRHDQSLR